MGALQPESDEMMAFYVANLEEYVSAADACHIKSFSPQLRKDLLGHLASEENVRTIEAVVRLGGFGETQEIYANRAAVSRLLKLRGITLKRGKRTAAGLLELVESATPLLLRFGVPLKTGETSVLVELLDLIAKEMEVSGDPRHELRRLKGAEKKSREREKGVQRHFQQLLARVWAQLKPPK